MSRSTSPAGRPSVVIVGAGPRGTGLIERIAANAPELYGDAPLDLHLVDPHPPGGGRIWRAGQSPLLWMNSTAEDVTMFTDETVEQDGPVRPGPSLAEWARAVRDGEIPVAPGPAEALESLGPRDFAGRQLQGAYLSWVYERSVAALPPAVTVHEHRAAGGTGLGLARGPAAGAAGGPPRTPHRRPRGPHAGPSGRRTQAG